MIHIKYHKWNKKQRKTLNQSCQKILKIKELQFYQPYFSLYFHIHNTKNSHKTLDLERRFFLNEVLSITNEKYHTSNIHTKCKVFDKMKQISYEKELFCKCIPLLNPMYYIMNNYNNYIHRNHLLPSCYNYNTYQKINSLTNNAYIDNFFSFICSEITVNGKSPSFPIYYGSMNGIKNEFNYDITDDYDIFKEEFWFHKNMKEQDFEIDMYVSSDSESESDSDSDSDSESDSENDYVICLKDIPCQLFFIEKLEGTLEDLLDDFDTLNIDIILSCIFQISFALMYLQKYYSFTHNDLHVNNVMYIQTDKIFLYYKFNNIYYKIPTHGYIFKIIDFGRSIFTFHDKLFFNDTFEKHGEADGQYSVPYDYLTFKEESLDKVEPNYHFDLCRLAITILDVCGHDKQKNYFKKQAFIDFIYNLTLTEDGESLADLEDDFDMYIQISKYACNALPQKTIQNIIFNQYRIKKKDFPKRSYYTL